MIWFYLTRRNAPGLRLAAPMRKLFALTLLVGGFDAPLDALAARPMAVDDASILDAKSCQLESWRAHGGGQSEAWAMPACNFGGDWEMALGAARIGASTTTLLQGKTVFRPLATDDWGIGLVLARQAGAGAAWSANVPFSVSLGGDRLVLHANTGLQRDTVEKSSAASWGLGADIALGKRSGLTVETLGQQRGRPLRQAGLRHSLLHDRLQIDATYGKRGGEAVVSLGMTITGNALLH